MIKNPKFIRSIVACLAAALAIVVTFVTLLILMGAGGFGVQTIMPLLLIFFGVSAILICIGLPIQAIMQKYGYVGYLTHVFTSSLVALIISIFFIGIGFETIVADIGMVIFAFVGSTTAWLVRRPDLDDRIKARPGET